MRYKENVVVDEDSGMLDMSISGDEEEQHRIELEHNLQDFSIQLSVSNPSNTDEEEQNPTYHKDSRRVHCRPYADMDSSDELEYPRHDPRPREVSIFDGHGTSVLDPSQTDYEPNYYPYRPGEEEDGTHYAADTFSTAAHHASAVTLSAGLAGRGDKRSHAVDMSMSGMEYDPDRPLDNVVKGVINDLSMLNMSAQNPKAKKSHSRVGQVSFDPTIIGHKHRSEMAPRNLSRSFSQPGSKGYRMGQINTNSRVELEPRFSSSHSRQGLRSMQYSLPDRDLTPRANSKVKQPSFNLQPPTPSMAADTTEGGSQFSRLARGLARDISTNKVNTKQEYGKETSRRSRSAKKSHSSRVPFQDVENTAKSTALKAAADFYNYEPSRSKGVQLPDVTGLTSAVGSPLKKDLDWRGYMGAEGVEGVETQLLQALTTLQTRLNQLESQNLMSRRRVRELELELEACKADVKRERTRVLEREEIIVAQQKDFSKRKLGPSRLQTTNADIEELEKRYKEVVEEKKALQALIATLRSHLSRLTSELSSHRAQLAELRITHEADVHDLQQKLQEVDHLKIEIERLAGEVLALRGIVEEGLEERRKAKEMSESGDKSQINDSTNIIEVDGSDQQLNHADAQESTEWKSTALVPPEPSMTELQHVPNKTMRTDYATVGSSHSAEVTHGRFIRDDELERVSAELEERRSERSEMSLQRSSGEQSSSFNGGDAQGQSEIFVDPTPGSARDKRRDSRKRPGRATPPNCETQNDAPATPFPQIRGERLERLFFSAPEHNTKTCRVCHRRRRPGASDDELDFPSWMPPRKRTRLHREGVQRRQRVEENSPDDQSNLRHNAPYSEDRLPPQTVLVRVLRELEDDFTHYKGIYCELADQYKLMDPASNVLKRNVLAEHLKEVVDTLEQKGDQIASLYDLLAFKDKPAQNSGPFIARRQRTLKKHATHP